MAHYSGMKLIRYKISGEVKHESAYVNSVLIMRLATRVYESDSTEQRTNV